MQSSSTRIRSPFFAAFKPELEAERDSMLDAKLIEQSIVADVNRLIAIGGKGKTRTFLTALIIAKLINR
jgi:hypothetical protein